MPTTRDLISPPPLVTSDGQFRVIDGDTIGVRMPDGSERSLRLRGFDAPEVDKLDRGLGNQGTVGGVRSKAELYDFLERGLADGTLRIDEDGRDVYGRGLARVSAGGVDFSTHMIRTGHGVSRGGSETPRSLDFEQMGPAEQRRRQEAFDAQYYGVESDATRLADQGMSGAQGSNFRRSVRRGTDQLYGGLHALMGNDAIAEEYSWAINANPRDVAQFKDIENPGDFGKWFVQLIGEQVPSLGLDAAMGLTGAGAGAVLTRRAALGGATGLASSGVGTAARHGATAGTLTSMWAQSAGSVAESLREEDHVEYGRRLAFASGAGAVMAPINLIATGRVLTDAARALGVRNPRIFADQLDPLLQTPQFRARVAQVASVSGTEAVAEFLQSAVAEVARVTAVTGRMPTAEEMNTWLQTEAFEAFISGAFLGGAISGGAHTVGGGVQYTMAKMAHARESREMAAEQAIVEADMQERDIIREAREAVRARDEAMISEPSADGLAREANVQAESPQSISLQVDDLVSGRRDALYLAPSNRVEGDVAYLESEIPDIGLVEDADGGLTVLNLDTLAQRSDGDAIQAALQVLQNEAAPQEAREQARGTLLGYAYPDAKQRAMAGEPMVVVQELKDDVVAREELVPVADAERVVEGYRQRAGDDREVRVRTPEDVVERRQEAMDAITGEGQEQAPTGTDQEVAAQLQRQEAELRQAQEQDAQQAEAPVEQAPVSSQARRNENVTRQHRILREDLRRNPHTMYVFGDNMREEGRGGQARQMRGEPNAVGIPTKHAPNMQPEAFFSDDDLADVRGKIDAAFDRLEAHIDSGGKVVIPEDGVGSGLARLEQHAPGIDAYIKGRLEALEYRQAEYRQARNAAEAPRYKNETQESAAETFAIFENAADLGEAIEGMQRRADELGLEGLSSILRMLTQVDAIQETSIAVLPYRKGSVSGLTAGRFTGPRPEHPNGRVSLRREVFNGDKIQSSARLIATFTHEALHAASILGIAAQQGGQPRGLKDMVFELSSPDSVLTLEQLRQSVRKRFHEMQESGALRSAFTPSEVRKIAAGLSITDEFFTHVLTSPTMQDFLTMIPAKDLADFAGQPESLWDAFVRALREWIGVAESSDALGEALRIASLVLEDAGVDLTRYGQDLMDARTRQMETEAELVGTDETAEGGFGTVVEDSTFRDSDEEVSADLQQRTTRVQDEGAAALNDIAKRYSRREFRYDAANTANAVKALKKAYPSVSFAVEGTETTGLYIVPRVAEFKTKGEAQHEADRLNADMPENGSLIFFPVQVRDVDGGRPEVTTWKVEAHLMEVNDATVLARKFLPEALAKGVALANRPTAATREYVMVISPQGRELPLAVAPLLEWGRRVDTQRGGEMYTADERNTSFMSGVAELMLMGYKFAGGFGGINIGTTENPQLFGVKTYSAPKRPHTFAQRIQEALASDPGDFYAYVVENAERVVPILQQRYPQFITPELVAMLNMEQETRASEGLLARLQEGRDDATRQRRATAQAANERDFRNLMNARRKVAYELQQLQGVWAKAAIGARLTPRQIETRDQIKLLRDRLDSIDAGLEAIANRGVVIENTAFNRAKKATQKNEDTGKLESVWVRNVDPADGTPGFFAQQALAPAEAKVSDRLVAYGGNSLQRRTINTLMQTLGGKANVVFAVGDSLPDTPINRPALKEIQKKQALGINGAVIYGAGSDYAVVWIREGLDTATQTAVIAHELGHIYVDGVLNDMRLNAPADYVQFMSHMQRAGAFKEADASRDAHEIMADHFALVAMGEVDRTFNAATPPTVYGRIKAKIRRLWRDATAILRKDGANSGTALRKQFKQWIADGRLKEVRTGALSGGRVPLSRNFTEAAGKFRPAQLTRLYSGIRDALGTVIKGSSPVWATIDGRLRAFESPWGKALADMLWTPPGTPGRGKRTNYKGQALNASRRWQGVFEHIEKTLGKERFQNAMDEYVSTPENQPLSADAQRIEQFFERFHSEFLQPAMPTLGKVKKRYAPSLYDVDSVLHREREFVDILVKYIDPQTGKNYTRDRAQAVAYGITTIHGFHDTEQSALDALLDGEERRPGATAANASHSRMLSDPALIRELREAGFFYPDNGEAVAHYIWQMSKRAAFENVFGGYGVSGLTRVYSPESLFQLERYMRQQNNTELNRLLQGKDQGESRYRRLIQHGLRTRFITAVGATDGALSYRFYEPAYHLREALDGIKRENQQEGQQALNMMKAAFGRLGTDMSPEFRKVQSRIATYQAYTTLAFSAVASFPDLMGPILRMRNIEYMLPALAESFRSLKMWKDTDQAARTFGLSSERMDAVQITEMYGMQFQDALSQKASNALFKYNGQMYFTHMSRAVALNVGIDAIKRAANDGDRGAAFLAEIGLTAAEVKAWQQSAVKTVEDVYEGRGTDAERKAANNIHDALARFVDESIIRPNSQLRPAWASSPYGMLFWQLKSFFYAYGKVVVRPFIQHTYNQIRAGNIAAGLAPYVIAVPGLLMLSALTMAVRNVIQKGVSAALMAPMAAVSDDWKEELKRIHGNSYFDRLSGMEYWWEVVRRTGVFGPFELMMGLFENRPLDSRVTGILGPAPNQFSELVKNAGDAAKAGVANPWGSKVAGMGDSMLPSMLRAVPGVNQLSSFKQAVYNVADDN